jgi:hypothetical protein
LLQETAGSLAGVAIVDSEWQACGDELRARGTTDHSFFFVSISMHDFRISVPGLCGSHGKLAWLAQSADMAGRDLGTLIDMTKVGVL